MASITSETSYWIKFFTDAGIPAGDAAHYAIVFSDNRISKEMLLDLSKEYLTDMGIARLGDVIGILKHAKKVHNQDAKDMLLKSSSLALRSASPSLNTPSPRRSTAASRMVNQITSKHPEAGPMSQQPSPRPVSPDLPNMKRKVSVFDRLGAEDGDFTVSVPKASAQSTPASVFNRLGGKSSVKRPAPSTFDDEEIEDSASLPYAGVLKNIDSPFQAKKAKKVELAPTVKMSSLKKKNFRIKKTIETADVIDVSVPSIQRPEVSTSTAGVLSVFAMKETPSLRERLGSKSELPSSSTSMKAEKTISKKGKASVQNRLGAKREEQPSSPVVSSTQQINVNLKKAKEISIQSAKQDTEKASGVFSRLGKMSKV